MTAPGAPAIVEEFRLPRGFDLFDSSEIALVRDICHERAKAAACDHLVLDLSETAIFGAEFLSGLLLVRRRLAAAGCGVALSRSNPLCAEILEITHLDELLRPPVGISSEKFVAGREG